MKIKRGDPVRVRLSDGEVVDAVYIGPFPLLEKCHIVKTGEAEYIALGGKYVRKGVRLEHGCRFVASTPGEC